MQNRTSETQLPSKETYALANELVNLSLDKQAEKLLSGNEQLIDILKNGYCVSYLLKILPIQNQILLLTLICLDAYMEDSLQFVSVLNAADPLLRKRIIPWVSKNGFKLLAFDKHIILENLTDSEKFQWLNNEDFLQTMLLGGINFSHFMNIHPFLSEENQAGFICNMHRSALFNFKSPDRIYDTMSDLNQIFEVVHRSNHKLLLEGCGPLEELSPSVADILDLMTRLDFSAYSILFLRFKNVLQSEVTFAQFIQMLVLVKESEYTIHSQVQLDLFTALNKTLNRLIPTSQTLELLYPILTEKFLPFVGQFLSFDYKVILEADSPLLVTPASDIKTYQDLKALLDSDQDQQSINVLIALGAKRLTILPDELHRAYVRTKLSAADRPRFDQLCREDKNTEKANLARGRARLDLWPKREQLATIQTIKSFKPST